jgi:tetratricopeptide (TPR) repeat protein
MSAEAVPELEQLAQSGDPEDLARLANQYARQGRLEEARRLFEELDVSSNPTVGSVLAVAEFRLASGQPDRAIATIDRLPDSVPEGRRMLIRADLLERAGRPTEATTLFVQAAETQNSGDAWLALARHYVRQNMPTEAKAAVDKGYAVAPNDPAIRSLAKGLALATGLPAPTGLESVALDANSNAEMRMLSAIQALRDQPGAIEPYVAQVRSVVADFPRYFPARRLLIMALAERGEWDSAVDAAREAVRVLPIDAQPAQLLTEVYAARAQFEGNRGLPEAQKQFTEQALAAAREWRARSLADPFDADVAIADLQDRLNNPREGLRVLAPYSDRLAQAGLAVAPLRARMHAKVGQAEAAEAVLMPMAQSEEEWAVLHAETARHLTNDPAAVRAWLARSEAFVGDSVRGRLMLAQAWYDLATRSKQDSDHMESARFLESLSPQDRAGGGALLLGTIYELLRRPVDAERVYRESIAVIPEEPITLNNLSFLLTSQGIKLDEAIELAERAVANSERFGFPPSQRVNFIDSLGEALTRAGRFDEASTTFRKGLALEPTNRLLMIGLAESLIGAGKANEARPWLTQLEQTAPVRAVDDPLNSRLREANARVNSGR